MSNSTATLNPEQLLWAEQFLVDNDAYLSALRAGVSPQTAREVGKRHASSPKVVAYVQKRRAAMLKPKELTRAELMGALVQTAELADEVRNPSAKLGALHEIAVMSGIKPEEPSTELTGSQKKVKQNLTAMTDNQLYKLIDPEGAMW